MDEEGYVTITGRIKDLIIKGGENIHPLEVENCLFAHPAVAEVSVVGLPDERYGEVVAAFIVPHEGSQIEADEVRSWVREKLSHHLGMFLALSAVTTNALLPSYGLLTGCSAEIRLLGGHIPQNSERQNSKVSAEGDGDHVAERRQGFQVDRLEF